MDRVKIFDTTLRDGEQSPGCSMNTAEKVDVARQLEKLGVDIIEAGFAISSKGDFEAIEAISQTVSNPTVCSLCRAVPADIKFAADAIKKAQKQRIHTFIATSPIHMKYKLNMSPDQVIERAVSAVTLAKGYVDDVEFSCEDAGRSEQDFLVEILTRVIQAGATVVNIPDTVGYQTPDEYGRLIKHLSEMVPGIQNVDISVHCHNDLGMATANSLAGVVNGARQIECTINGIGERAGNTALEEVAMAIQTRSDIYNVETGIQSKEILKTSRLVSSITGSLVQANKAIVGANAFAHEAGIHQDGILKQRETYEIMDPKDIGFTETNLVLGKHSGRHAFLDKCKELGYTLDDTALNKAFERFKNLADKKKTIADQDIESILSDESTHFPEVYQLDYIQIVAGNTTKPCAIVSLKKDGELIEVSEIGAGPVDAIFKAIQTATGLEIPLVDYIIHAVTEGTDALGEVTLRIRQDEQVYTGRGSALDVLVASAKAYISAINKMLSY